MSIWGRWTRYRRAQRARMDEFRARDLGFDEQASRAAYGGLEPSGDADQPDQPDHAEQPEQDLLASTLPLAPSDAGRGTRAATRR